MPTTVFGRQVMGVVWWSARWRVQSLDSSFTYMHICRSIKAMHGHTLHIHTHDHVQTKRTMWVTVIALYCGTASHWLRQSSPITQQCSKWPLQTPQQPAALPRFGAKAKACYWLCTSHMLATHYPRLHAIVVHHREAGHTRCDASGHTHGCAYRREK